MSFITESAEYLEKRLHDLKYKQYFFHGTDSLDDLFEEINILREKQEIKFALESTDPKVFNMYKKLITPSLFPVKYKKIDE